MAPMDQLRRDSIGDLRRRHDTRNVVPLRRKDGGDGDGGKGSGGKRGDGNGDGGGGSGGGGGNGNGNGNGNGDNGGGKNNNNDNQKNGDGGDGKPKSSPPQAASEPGPPPPFVSTTIQSAAPTTIVLVSTTTAPVVLTTTAPAIEATSSSNTFISTFFPVTSPAPFPTLSAGAFSNPPDSASQPRKGLTDDPNFPPSRSPKTVTATMTSSMFLIPESALASSSSTASAKPTANNNNNHHPKNKGNPGDLTPLAQHLLIAAGAIGAFIIVVAGVYFLTRARKIDIPAFFRNRKFGRGGSRGWYGWRKEETDYMSEPPPKYSGEAYPSEKNIPAQQQVEAFYTPTAVPPMATPASAANALERSNSGRQETMREALLDNPAPFATSPATQTGAISATENFYGVSAQATSLSRQPGTQNSQSTFVSQPNSNYNNTGTQNTFLTMRTVQTQDAYDPNQREPNHLSYLSSLSSGFGDGLIIPDPTVVGGGRQSYRQSKAPGAGRFSWMTSNRGSRAPYGDRDTVYTTTSVDSAPRFRTVNSWVAQQAGRVERQQDVPALPPLPLGTSLPPLPLPLQIGGGADHQRKPSEDPAFRQHPGDEIQIGRGSRVPSSILDGKVGAN